jgi:hypothetical protein
VTTSLGNQKYDLRAVATASGTVQVSAVVANVLVDNSAPTITLQDPGSPLRGTVTFTTAAADTHSGLAKVVVQYAASGTSTWQDLCSATSNPWSCGYDTTRLNDGTYSFRAVASDVAGNSATSSAVTNRAVNNTVSSVSLSDPGQYLGGTVTLNVSASSTAGVVSVRIQRSPTGAGTWTDICTDTTAPYSCSFNTTAVADGSYDLRAVLVDGAGKTTVSAVVTARRVDNTPVRGVDVQAISGGSTSGRVDAGDQLTFAYSEELTLGSVTPGWTGSALAVTLRVRDGNLLGLGNKGDTVDVLLNGTAINLGSVTLNEDYIAVNQTVQFSATLTASGTTVSGAPATLLTLTVGGLPSGNGLKTVATAASMVWTPSAAVTDLAGRAASTAPVTEAGSADREF